MIKYKKDGILIGSDFIPLHLITKNCVAEKVKEENLSLLIIGWKASRGFDGIHEVRAYPNNVCEKIKEFIVGKTVSFGEIAGKHSDVYGEIQEQHVTIEPRSFLVIDFILDYPKLEIYNYSFLETLHENYSSLDDEDLKEYELTKEDVENFANLIQRPC